MEAKLQFQSLNGYREIFSQQIQKEQSQDCVVPDTLPDIGSVICTDGTPLIRSKDVAFGRVRLEANIPVRTAFYGEDGEICSMDINLPFYFTVENEQIPDGCRVSVALTADTLETRILNPRKISVRAVLTVSLRVFSGEAQMLPTDAEPAPAGIHVLRKTETVTGIRAITEKTFVLADEVPIPVDKPAESVLARSVRLFTANLKYVGTRCILKGRADSSILYRAEDGSVNALQFSTEFSQIADMEQEAASPFLQSRLLLSGLYYDIRPDSGGTSLTMELHAVAELYLSDQTELTCLIDAYSNRFPLELRSEPRQFTLTESEGETADAVTAAIPLPEIPAAILSYSVDLNSLSMDGDTAVLVFRALLYLRDGEGSIRSVTRDLSSSVKLSCPAGKRLRVSDVSFSGVSAVPDASGAALHFEVLLRYAVCSDTETNVVTGISYDETAACDPTLLPSVVLVRKGETADLWSLAREYCSTVEAIEKANPSPETDSNLFLLIPRSL